MRGAPISLRLPVSALPPSPQHQQRTVRVKHDGWVVNLEHNATSHMNSWIRAAAILAAASRQVGAVALHQYAPRTWYGVPMVLLLTKGALNCSHGPSGESENRMFVVLPLQATSSPGCLHVLPLSPPEQSVHGSMPLLGVPQPMW